MDKTPFSKKVEILGDYYAEICEDDVLMSMQSMQEHRDILFLCLASGGKWITLNEERVGWFIEDTWKYFCELFRVDHYGEYQDYKSLVDFANE